MQKYARHIKTLALSVLLMALRVQGAGAQAEGFFEGTREGGCNRLPWGCGFCDAAQVAVNIIDFLVQITLAIGVVAIVYGGILIAVSGASPSQMETGKKAIKSAILGIIIALASWAIVNTVIHLLTGNPAYPWAEITCEISAQ